MTVKVKIQNDELISEVLEESQHHYLLQYDGDWVWFLKRDCEILPSKGLLYQINTFRKDINVPVKFTQKELKYYLKYETN